MDASADMRFDARRCQRPPALAKERAPFEIIAPKIGGAKASDGSWLEADRMIDGGPSVLYDAIALLTAQAEMDNLVPEFRRRAISSLTLSRIASSSATRRSHLGST